MAAERESETARTNLLNAVVHGKNSIPQCTGRAPLVRVVWARCAYQTDSVATRRLEFIDLAGYHEDILFLPQFESLVVFVIGR